MNHVKFSKHMESKSKQAKGIEHCYCSKRYDQSSRARGDMLPEDQRVYRVKILRTFKSRCAYFKV